MGKKGDQIIIYLLPALMLLLTSCNPATYLSNPTPLSTTEAIVTDVDADELSEMKNRLARDYPSVDGSTSAHPLQILMACEILDIPCVWQEAFLDMTRRPAPDLNQDLTTEAVEKIFNIHHNGTHSAYVNLIEKEADFILVARSPSADEKQAARLRGIELDIQPIALDAFVFLGHAENPVEELSLETIRDIYTGKIIRWSQLNGVIPGTSQEEDQIHTYKRNPNSGSQELMESLVMMGEQMIDSPDMELLSMMGPINAISEDPQGIGYSVFYYTQFMYPNENVKMFAVEGYPPTTSSISARDYPLTTEVYAVMRVDTPGDRTAWLLRDWLLSQAGQAVVNESGYVPIRPPATSYTHE